MSDVPVYARLCDLAQQSGFSVRIYNVGSELRQLAVFDPIDKEVPVAASSLDGKRLDEAAVSCLEQMRRQGVDWKQAA